MPSALKMGLHLGDLEPGAQENCNFARRMVGSIKDSEPADTEAARHLFWLIVEIQDWRKPNASNSR